MILFSVIKIPECKKFYKLAALHSKQSFQTKANGFVTLEVCS